MGDVTCRTCFAVRNCVIRVIDCTEALPDYVLQLGLSEAVDSINSMKGKLPATLLAYDTDWGDNPVLMSRASKCSWHESTYKKDIEDALDDLVKPLGLGGRK
jgi:hypothetical protein